MAKPPLLSGVEIATYSIGLGFLIIAISAGINARSFRFNEKEDQVGVPFVVAVAAVLAFIAPTANETFLIEEKALANQVTIVKDIASEKRLLEQDRWLDGQILLTSPYDFNLALRNNDPRNVGSGDPNNNSGWQEILGWRREKRASAPRVFEEDSSKPTNQLSPGE